MHVRGTDALPLAPRPDLDQYRTLAKDFVKARRTGSDATREWAAAWMNRLARLRGLPVTTDQLDRRIDDVLRDVAGTRILDEPSLSDAQLFIARLHGFESWPKFVRHVDDRQQDTTPVSQFELAADAIVAGDLATLTRLLHDNPSLIHARSAREHRATLLHYVAANGHEGFRQRTPKNAVDVARLLLSSGAEVDALADMYGHRVTTMQMLVSSAHPHNAGVQVALVDTLLDFGANPNGVEDDGSPIMTAFRFHYPKAAEALARRGARVDDNVIAASAVGRVDVVDRLVDDEGHLRDGVPRESGPWPKLSRDPAEHLGYALTWAAMYGRDDVVELLLKKGVDPSGHDDDVGVLHAAAAAGRMHLVRLLLALGASLEELNSYGGTVLDGTVWYALNAPAADVNYVTVVRELLDLGARTDVYPEMKSYVELVLAGQRGGGYPGEVAESR